MEKKTAKEISYKVWTRGMDREFNSILMGDKEISLNGEPSNAKISFEQSQKALDFMISSLTDLTQEEIDKLDMPTYNDIKDKCIHIKNGSNK